MNRSYPRWLVGLALIFAQNGCAADATSVATATDATDTPIAQSSDPAPESEEQIEAPSSTMSSVAVAIIEPVPSIRPREDVVTFLPREEVLGPQPVPWCVAIICEAKTCRCFTNLIDRPVPFGFALEGKMDLGEARFEPR